MTAGNCAGLRDIVRAGEIAEPGEEQHRAEQHDGNAPAARDREHAAEQPRAAIDHRGEDHAAEDDQQGAANVDREHDRTDDRSPDQRAGNSYRRRGSEIIDGLYPRVRDPGSASAE